MSDLSKLPPPGNCLPTGVTDLQGKSKRMRRRDFIAFIGSAAAVRPLGARAQAPNLRMIGFLSTGAPGSIATYVAAFQHGMGELGYVEGRNIAITYRWAQTRSDQLDMLANDLVRHQVKLIAASGGL